MSIAAYYQCYKQPLAFEHCLKNFREHYPTSELWIVNDGGDPTLKEIAESYSPTQYEYEDNLSIETNATIYSKPETILQWLARLRKCTMATEADFILLLEDDVFVMKPTTGLQYDINGCNKGVRFPNSSIEQLIRSRNPNAPNPLYYGACGGCFFRVSFLRKIFENFTEVENDIKLFGIYSNCFASDMVLSYLVWIHGGTIDQYPGFAETWYSDYKYRLQNGSIEVLHQYKNYYRSNQSGSQGYVFIANGLLYANMLKEYTIPSIRHFDKIRPITILTSTPQYFTSTLYTIIEYDPEEQCKRYKHLNSSDFFIFGTVPKLMIFDMSPYDENIYLDTDIINMKDINEFWNFCSSSEKQVVITGESDANNDAPSTWHWNTVQEVIEKTGVHIPRVNSGVFYWRKHNDFMNTIQPYLADPSKYKIKPWFRGGYPDEIFISIYLGIKGIRPERDEDANPPNPNSIQTYRTEYSPYGNAQFFHIFNKQILYQYFNLFLERNPSAKA